MSANYPGKIIALWTVFLLGTVFHTQLALMPIFHGISVAQSHTHEFIDLSSILWLMLGFFLLPMMAIIATAFNNSRRYRVFHFGLTLLYSVMNLLHLVLDLFVSVPNYQIALMGFLLLVGILLNIVSFQWMQSPSHRHRVVKMS